MIDPLRGPAAPAATPARDAPDDDTGLAGELDETWRRIIRGHRQSIAAEVARLLASGATIDEPTLLRVVLAQLVDSTVDSRLAATAASVVNAIVRADSARLQALDALLDEIPEVLGEIRAEILAAKQPAAPDPKGVHP